MAEYEDIIRHDDYDGIQEYDNPLPGWWTWLFIGSIVFSVLYFWYYEFGAPGRTVYDAYAADVAANLRLQFAEIGELSPDRDTILKYMNEPQWLTVGESVFQANCVSCHGASGQGLVGPNLTDDAYKNVKVVEDIATVVANGAANQAMPAWKNRLHPNELVLVSAYVATLRGTNAAGGKPPEGNVIPPWDSGEKGATKEESPSTADESAPKTDEATPQPKE